MTLIFPQVDPDRLVDLVVAHAYHKKFERHSSPGSIAAVLETLKRSKLAERTKESLPTRERLVCTAQNANWLLCYWLEFGFPDPAQERFGYVKGKHGVQFAC